MKKFICCLFLLIGSLGFSVNNKAEIYDLITQIEEMPENPDYNEQWQKILKFSIEDEEATIYMIWEILGNAEKDKIDDDTRSVLLMSYIMGSLKEQLVSEKEISEDENIKNGVLAALKTYNRLKQTRDINVEFYELLNVDK